MPNADPRSEIPSPIAFVGGGNMARSLIGGLIARGAKPEGIVVSEPNDALRQALAQDFGVRVREDNRSAVQDAAMVVLAVKPQAMRQVCEQLAGNVSSAIVVSIAAGITCTQMERWLGRVGALVRCMPNTPALLGAGATGLYAATATPKQRAAAQTVLDAVGMSVWIEDEAQMDAVTALSGSGPAYAFLLAEAMQDAATALGLPAHAARLLTRQTLLGAARMLNESDESAATLRQRVTSPGGTTQAAIERFEAEGFRAIVERALAAAQRRGAELSRQMD